MNRNAWLALAAGAAVALALAGLALHRLAGSATMPVPSGPMAPPIRPPGPRELVSQKYNVVLQVRAHDDHGVAQPVGTTLPRMLQLVLTGQDGTAYAEPFDKVGLWAVEVPPGTYTIARVQEGLGAWKWTLSGDGLKRTGDGWTATFAAGTMNPQLDLLLY